MKSLDMLRPGVYLTALHGRELCEMPPYILTDRARSTGGGLTTAPFFYRAQPRSRHCAPTGQGGLMTENDLATRIRQHAEPLAAHLGLVIWGIEIAGGSRTVLRVFVETPVPAETSGEISADAADGPAARAWMLNIAPNPCAASGWLWIDDLFSGAWTLEVSRRVSSGPFSYRTVAAPCGAGN